MLFIILGIKFNSVALKLACAYVGDEECRVGPVEEVPGGIAVKHVCRETLQPGITQIGPVQDYDEAE